MTEPRMTSSRKGTCKICGSTDVKLMFTAPDFNLSTSDCWFSVSYCSSCDVAFTGIAEVNEFRDDFYPSTYPCHQGHSRVLGRRIANRIARASGSLSYCRWSDPLLLDLEGFSPREKSALDIGCGTGRLMASLGDQGWSVWGIEPSRHATIEARRQGLEVTTTSIEEAVIGDRAYSLVILHHSLEHTADPNAALSKCFRALAPEGLAVIAVPNFDCPGRRFFAEAWVPLDLPRHLYHFSTQSLTAILVRHGFRIERIYYENGLVDVVLSLRNWVRTRSPAGDRAPKLESSRVQSRSAVVGTLLTVLGIGLTWCYGPILRTLRATSRTSILVVARKPA